MLLYLDLIISHSEKLVKFCRIHLALARGILYIRYKGWMTMKKLLSLLLTLSMLFSLVGCELFSPKEKEIADDDAKLKVHFIDVGQGDCTLLESGGEFVLIDAGEKEMGSTVLKYIKSRDADSLKYVIATHPHSDHIGGLARVINGIDTENFITVETDQNTSTWRNVLKAVDQNDVNYIDAKVGDKYTFGEATFTVLAPHSDNYNGYNNYSVVTMVQCGDIRFLLTGDAEKESEKEMLDAGTDLRADVLKCGHHGSSTSSTASFLKAVDPSYAIISCGKNNDYGHPHKETLKKLKLLGCTYLRTDTMGTIVARTDGKYLSFSTDKGNSEIATYSAGETTYDGTAPTASSAQYIGNKNSHVFHLPECSGVKNMSEKNKVTFSSREEAVNADYKPCSTCNP